MPELPEVETTRQGIAPFVEGRRVMEVNIRERRLRWPVPAELESLLGGQRVERLGRRAKYLLFETAAGTVMIHLGMSGSLRLTTSEEPPRKHDHADFLLDSGRIMRFHDPRRFGSILWLEGEPELHPLLINLGPEPLSEDFHADYLWRASRKRSVPIKSFIMDSHVVVGVGNIYANEALFKAGIHPRRTAGKVSRAAYERLVQAVKTILAEAIRQGGTTLRDFVGGDGRPGYFKQSLAVYGRADQPCRVCGTALKDLRLGQRSTVFCKSCQR